MWAGSVVPKPFLSTLEHTRWPRTLLTMSYLIELMTSRIGLSRVQKTLTEIWARKLERKADPMGALSQPSSERREFATFWPLLLKTGTRDHD